MIVLFQGLWGFLLALETKSHFYRTNWAVTHFVAKAGLEFPVILLPVPPECWVIGMSHHTGSQVLLPAFLGIDTALLRHCRVTGKLISAILLHGGVPISQDTSISSLYMSFCFCVSSRCALRNPGLGKVRHGSSGGCQPSVPTLSTKMINVSLRLGFCS